MDTSSSVAPVSRDYAAIVNPFYRAEAIDADRRGNFGADVPAGLVYHAGFYLTPAERAAWIADDASHPHYPEDSLGLGLFNS